MVDLVIPNETELALLTGETNIVEGARKLLQMGANAVVVTLGSEGCFYKDAITRSPWRALKLML